MTHSIKIENGQKSIEGVATGWAVEGVEMVIFAINQDQLEKALEKLGQYSFDPVLFKRVEVFYRGDVDLTDPTATSLSRARLGGEE